VGIWGTLFNEPLGVFRPELLFLSIIMIVLFVFRFKFFQGWVVCQYYNCGANEIKSFFSKTITDGSMGHFKRFLVGFWIAFFFGYFYMLIMSNWRFGAACMAIGILAFPLGTLTLIYWLVR
jgi:hypothetical protein